MRMINADDLEQALRDAGLTEAIKDDCSKCTSAWGVPIVDVEPVKHGEWIPKITALGTMIFRCSACQKFSDVHWAYCPQCGAMMDGERGTND